MSSHEDHHRLQLIEIKSKINKLFDELIKKSKNLPVLVYLYPLQSAVDLT